MGNIFLAFTIKPDAEEVINVSAIYSNGMLSLNYLKSSLKSGFPKVINILSNIFYAINIHTSKVEVYLPLFI